MQAVKAAKGRITHLSLPYNRDDTGMGSCCQAESVAPGDGGFAPSFLQGLAGRLREVLRSAPYGR